MMFSSKQLLEEMPLYLTHEYDKRLLLYGDLISWKELEKLINNRPFMSNKRFQCTKSGDISWPNKSWLTDVNTYPPQAVEEMLKLGTCYIVDCSRVNKQINELCNMIESMVNAPTDAHIYFSQTKDESFGKHSDKNANIIIQQEGISHAKIWKDDELIVDKELTKGEMVFIPALCDHEITPITNRISVSFPIAFGHSDIQERDWIKLCMN